MTVKRKAQWGKRLPNKLREVNVIITEETYKRIEQVALHETKKPEVVLSEYIDENHNYIGVAREPRVKVIDGHGQVSFPYYPLGALVWYGLRRTGSETHAYVYSVMVGENDLLDSLSENVRKEIQQAAELDAHRTFNRLVEALVIDQIQLNQRKLEAQVKAEFDSKQEANGE